MRSSKLFFWVSRIAGSFKCLKVSILFRNVLIAALFSLDLLAQPFPGTAPLEMSGDLADQMVSGIGRYLDRAHSQNATNRARSWPGKSSPAEEFLENLRQTSATNRTRLQHILGVVDRRDPPQMRFVATVSTNAALNPAEVGRAARYTVYSVVWKVFRGVEGEGLLVVPEGEPKADVIVVPDCDWTPEQVIGLAPGLPLDQQFARRFAEAGCRLLIPALIDRGSRFAGNPGVRSVKHSQRETLWRAGYQMGRTPLGYEIQKLLAAADWLDATRLGGSQTNRTKIVATRIPTPLRQQLGIVGYGEGGLLALYAGALDTRFLAVGVCGAFGLGERNPELPIYRDVWSVLTRFGDAELAAMIMPRGLIVEHGQYPEVVHTDEHGGAPGKLWRPTSEEFDREQKRFRNLVPEDAYAFFLTASPQSVCGWGTAQRFYQKLASTETVAQTPGAPPASRGALPDEEARTRRQYLQILEDTQVLTRESDLSRRDFWKKADFKNLAAFTNSVSWYRDHFWDEIIGRLPKASLAPNPRSRFLYETNGYRGYEVVLDLHTDVFAYGILLVPTNIKTGEKRPVVVCQHGLEGRPRDLADPNVENPAYHRYACRLAERGFITFAPQNPYIGRTKFRQLLRNGHPIGLTLFSFIVRQHETITDWLASLDIVDPGRIGFYGLSYGGKTAMRVPPLVDRYALSICSADYNEWIWKNTSARSPYSYLWTVEYDMPEFNLGNTYNYAEMSWLIFPRPFMVERGHDDGVAPDEWVAYEFSRTRRHYVKMGLGPLATIEFFNGPHTINGQGTFDFLHEHLDWPKRP